jgi:hypothetical protein
MRHYNQYHLITQAYKYAQINVFQMWIDYVDKCNRYVLYRWGITVRASITTGHICTCTCNCSWLLPARTPATWPIRARLPANAGSINTRWCQHWSNCHTNYTWRLANERWSIPVHMCNIHAWIIHLRRFPSSVVLVRDGPNCDIVVDTGTALYKNTIVGGEMKICVRKCWLSGLAAHQIKLDAINNVILTHNDVDNMGNLNLVQK